mmetsp:Transcript_29436/g.96049  ORF Transcript_29436/g.96049 Transcript_29436/m.96049 type:complete len:790 (-) Transcript_29436:3387-5756(-)
MQLLHLQLLEVLLGLVDQLLVTAAQVCDGVVRLQRVAFQVAHLVVDLQQTRLQLVDGLLRVAELLLTLRDQPVQLGLHLVHHIVVRLGTVAQLLHLLLQRPLGRRQLLHRLAQLLHARLGVVQLRARAVDALGQLQLELVLAADLAKALHELLLGARHARRARGQGARQRQARRRLLRPLALECTLRALLRLPLVLRLSLHVRVQHQPRRPGGRHGRRLRLNHGALLRRLLGGLLGLLLLLLLQLLLRGSRGLHLLLDLGLHLSAHLRLDLLHGRLRCTRGTRGARAARGQHRLRRRQPRTQLLHLLLQLLGTVVLVLEPLHVLLMLLLRRTPQRRLLDGELLVRLRDRVRHHVLHARLVALAQLLARPRLDGLLLLLHGQLGVRAALDHLRACQLATLVRHQRALRLARQHVVLDAVRPDRRALHVRHRVRHLAAHARVQGVHQRLRLVRQLQPVHALRARHAQLRSREPGGHLVGEHVQELLRRTRRRARQLHLARAPRQRRSAQHRRVVPQLQQTRAQRLHLGAGHVRLRLGGLQLRLAQRVARRGALAQQLHDGVRLVNELLRSLLARRRRVLHLVRVHRLHLLRGGGRGGLEGRLALLLLRRVLRRRAHAAHVQAQTGRQLQHRLLRGTRQLPLLAVHRRRVAHHQGPVLAARRRRVRSLRRHRHTRGAHGRVERRLHARLDAVDRVERVVATRTQVHLGERLQLARVARHRLGRVRRRLGLRLRPLLVVGLQRLRVLDLLLHLGEGLGRLVRLGLGLRARLLQLRLQRGQRQLRLARLLRHHV